MDRGRAVTVVTLSAILAALALAPALPGGLVLDDPEVLISVPDSPKAFFSVLSKSIGGILADRPLARLSFVWDRFWFPGAFDPQAVASLGFSTPLGTFAPLRLTTLALHLVNVFCVWWLAARWVLPNRPWAATGAAVVFAVHPVSVGTVAYIAQRSMVLSVTGMLLGCIGFLAALARVRPGPGAGGRASLAGPLTLSGAGVLLAVLSHPQGVVVFLLLGGVALAAWRVSQRFRLMRGAAAAVGTAALAAAGLGLWLFAGEIRYWKIAPETAAGTCVSVQLPAVLGEIGEVLLGKPHPLDGAPAALRMLALPLACLVVVGIGRGTALRVVFGAVAASALAVLPAVAIPLKDSFFLHRLYPALPALAPALAAFLIPAREVMGGRSVALVCALSALFFLWLAGHHQGVILAEPLAAWTTSCREAPTKARAQMNAGNCWALAGRLLQARAHYRRALAIAPDHVGARESLKRMERPAWSRRDGEMGGHRDGKKGKRREE